MTSQSPVDEGRSKEYEDAWDAIQDLVMEQGGSWSGRERNCAYLNLGDGRFVNVSAVSGADYIDDSRAVVRIDWDGDGDQDMLLKGRTAPRLRVLRNDDQSGSHYLQLALVGAGINRDAIGALATVEAGGKAFTQRLYAGDGFLSQSSKVLHFGLGQATEVERVTIHWPDGSLQSFEQLPADCRLKIVQGESETKPTAQSLPRAQAFSDAKSEASSSKPRAVRRIPLVRKLPVAALHIPSFEDPVRRVSSLSGSPILLNLWATWCQNCLVEMGHFHERADELKATGVQIVCMSTDEVSELPKAKERLAGLGLIDGAGHVEESLQLALDVLMTEILGSTDSVALPASLLIDSHGEVVVLYNGPVEVDVLLEDLETLKKQSTEDPHATPFFEGLWVADRKRALGMLGRAFKTSGLEDLRLYYRQLGQARRKAREEQERQR